MQRLLQLLTTGILYAKLTDTGTVLGAVRAIDLLGRSTKMTERGKIIEWPGRREPGGQTQELSQDDEAGIMILEALRGPEVAQRYREALLLIRRGRLRAGVALIASLAEVGDESDLITASKLAELYIRYGRVHDALLPYEKVHRTSEPQPEKYYNMLATAYSQMRRYDDARRIYRKALEVLGDSVDVRVRIAQTYEMEGRYYRASKEYEAIRSEHPEDSYVANQLALDYIRTQRATRALDMYKEVADRGSSDALERGIASLALRRAEEAIVLLQKTMEEYPEDALAYYYSTLAYVIAEDWDKVEEYLIQALQLDPGLWYGDVQSFTSWLLTDEEFSRLTRIWPDEIVTEVRQEE